MLQFSVVIEGKYFQTHYKISDITLSKRVAIEGFKIIFGWSDETCR